MVNLSDIIHIGGRILNDKHGIGGKVPQALMKFASGDRKGARHVLEDMAGNYATKGLQMLDNKFSKPPTTAKGLNKKVQRSVMESEMGDLVTRGLKYADGMIFK